MKRTLCLLLSICMLTSLITLLSACQKKPETVPLDGYRVVCGDDASATSAAVMNSFYSTLKKRVDGSMTYKTVKPTETLRGDQELEILIGNTNRPETAQAREKIEGDGYAIVFFENQKIAIVGTSVLFTLQALDRFTAEFLGGTETLTGIEKRDIIESNKKTIEIAARSVFVYSSNLRTGDSIIKSIAAQKTAIAEFSDVVGSSMLAVADSSSKSSFEIICGISNREAGCEFLAMLDANTYGVAVKGNHVVVGALNDHTMEKAFEFFNDILKDGVTVQDGKKKIFLPSDLSLVQTDTQNKTFVTDFPRPDGLALSGSMDVAENNLQYYYSGEGVNLAAYEAYCQKLIGEGYTLVSTNSGEGNVFRTYKNTDKNIMLYVAYNSFKHAAAGMGFDSCIRIVSSRLSTNNHLPDEMLVQDLSFARKQNSSITAVKLNSQYQASGHNIYGNNYVITLEDGSFIMYDGGGSYETDIDRLYKVLLDLYKKGHNGQNPTADDPIRISAWLISHGHGDHFNIMRDFITQYASKWGSYYITLDNLIANFTSDNEDDLSSNPENHMRDKWKTYSDMIKDTPGKEAGFRFIKVHTGQKFYIANAEFEVMYTHEELYPARLVTYNSSSTVFRMTLHHTQNGTISTGSSTTMLWLGDAETEASRVMRALWGTALKSDMVQVAHHNYNGCEWELYQLVKPECVWWPVNRARWKSTTHKSNPTGADLVCYNINYKLASVKYIILSDDYNYTLSITATGPDYLPNHSSATGVCNVGEGNSFIASPVAVSKSATTSFMKK